MSNKTPKQTIADAVIHGLEKQPMRLPSWLFYDEHGDALFQEIMKLPEYYLTDCEFEILQQQGHSIFEILSQGDGPIELIELGAGDGTKTELLLRHLLKEKLDLIYRPTDISGNILKVVKERLEKNLPELKVQPIQGIHKDVLPQISKQGKHRKAFLFLGASIGNYDLPDAREFFGWVADALSGDDLFMVGFDLKKDPNLILSAYNDKQGITRQFNLNLLRRINSDLGANFNLDQWEHYPIYDPVTGEARSYLYSKRTQRVEIREVGRTFDFRSADLIQTEISQKYDQEMIDSLATSAQLERTHTLYDCRHYFCISAFRRMSASTT